MTRLFQELNGQAEKPAQAPVQNSFVREAVKQGFKPTIPDFIRFCKMADGKDMKGVLQELRETGQMDEAKYEQCKQQAQGFMGLLKMFLK